MNDTNVIEIATQTLMIAAKISAPILLVTLALGLGVSLVQSVTQVQEHTITFVPKLAGVAVVILFSGNWMLSELIGFTNHLFALIPDLIR
ncbi:MAG TPA: flagellar biosynthetic protein FliQ [Acidimicrobiales bacterium]